MTLLNRDAILAADDREYEDVECPEWGGTVRVRAMSGTERDSYEASCVQERPVYDGRGRPVKGQYEFRRTLDNVRAKLVVRCVVNEDGSRMFEDGDAFALGEKSAAALDRVFDVAARLSRISDSDIEELAGNSGAGQSGDSPSISPSSSAAPSASSSDGLTPPS